VFFMKGYTMSLIKELAFIIVIIVTAM
jgi:hypothetical protein